MRSAPVPDICTVTLRLESSAHLGVGRGSGFSATSHHYIPAATWRGAVCAAWWRDAAGAGGPSPDGNLQRTFDGLVRGLAFGDAVGIDDDEGMLPKAIALDQRTCKYCPTDPPAAHRWDVSICPTCKGPTEPGKGQRINPKSVKIRQVTRVKLTPQEQAQENMLYERESLHSPGVALLALLAGDPAGMVRPGAVVRLGGARSVTGRATIDAVSEPIKPEEVLLPSDLAQLRIELLSPGCYVDEFGRASSLPSERDLKLALRLPADAHATVTRSFTRWGMSGGWHIMAKGPKPEDAVVIAHSVHYVTVTGARGVRVPSLVPDLGLRTSEGCGWAHITEHSDAEVTDCA